MPILKSRDNLSLFMLVTQWRGVLTCLCISFLPGAFAGVVDQDPLSIAITSPPNLVNRESNEVHVFLSEQLGHDDNLYRLPKQVVDVTSLNGISSDAKRQDSIGTLSVGTDGQWNVGRQNIVFDLRLDKNNFDANSNLNNVSSTGNLVWSWVASNHLSGELGANYNRGLVSFVNTINFFRDLYTTKDYFGFGRYQVGPHWAVFAGLIDSRTTLSEASTQLNDLRAKTIDIGTELATSRQDKIGAEYKLTTASYPAGAALDDDYREDTALVTGKHVFTEKTNIEGKFGFMNRKYSSEQLGQFAGDIWQLSLQWHPTAKLNFEVDGWKNLQAYVTAQSDFYVARGQRISPKWLISEKLSLAVVLSLEDQRYIGVGENLFAQGGRRDRVISSRSSLRYAPKSFLFLDFDYSIEKRNSNQSQFQYNDNIFSAKITVKR